MRTLNIVVIILVFIFGIYQMRNASSVLNTDWFKNLNYNDLAVICKNKLTLKEARIAAGISQAELAKRSGVKKCSISSYEQNRTSFNKIAFGTVKKFAEALNIPMECLESDEE